MEELEDEELYCENQKMSNGTGQRLIVFMRLLVCAGKAIAKISEKMNTGEFEKDDEIIAKIIEEINTDEFEDDVDKIIAKISEKMNIGEFQKDDNSSQLSNHDSKNDDYENE